MTEPTVPVEQKPDERSRTSWGKIGIFISMLALLVFIGGFGYGYYQLSQINLALARDVANLESKVAKHQTDLEKNQSDITSLSSAAQKSEDLSKQQEQLMAEWRAAQQGDLNKWHVAEAQYLVKLANDQLNFNHATTLATALLKRADDVLSSSDDAHVLEIRKSIATDLANLAAVPSVDITDLYLKLVGLNKQVDQLQLPSNPLSPEVVTLATPMPADAPWYKVGWQKTLDALHKIVIVRYNTSASVPLALPDEKIFLYQNLHAQFETAMLALLNRNSEIYKASLTRTQDWIKQYFAQDSATTKAMLDSLNDLVKVDIQPQTINLGNTLQLFDAYLPAQAATPQKTSEAKQ